MTMQDGRNIPFAAGSDSRVVTLQERMHDMVHYECAVARKNRRPTEFMPFPEEEIAYCLENNFHFSLFLDSVGGKWVKIPERFLPRFCNVKYDNYIRRARNEDRYIYFAYRKGD